MTPLVTTLYSQHRDRVWKSTLNGAQYRWAGDEWEVKTSVADWHPPKAGMKTQVIYAQSSERFVEL